MKVYLGIDVGSVTTKFAVLDEADQLLTSLYLRTEGQPITKLQQGLGELSQRLPPDLQVQAVGATGSARYLAGAIVNADIIKNEITCHAIAALNAIPEVQTIIEIGGQDSKIILIRDGVVVDFGMNTVCAAGTGSFLEHQALRLNIAVEEISQRALNSQTPVRIAGRCTVFAESDMVHKQQIGHSMEDILYGLCQALVRNYLNNVGLGREVKPPVVFQGGVAFNQGIVKAFEEALETKLIVPPHHEVMGAIGAALLAHEEGVTESQFLGFQISQHQYKSSSFECKACANLCEIAQISLNGRTLARWGGRCDLWERVKTA